MDWAGKTRLGDGWACYEGATGDSRPHRHVAVQLALGLKQPVAVTGDRGTVVGAAVLIRAGARHRLAPVAGGVRCVFVEVDSRAGQQWMSGDADAEIVRAPPKLGRALRQAGDLAAALDRLTRSQPDRVLDARLVRALAGLADNPSGVGAIARAATAAQVSVSCLRALAARSLSAPLSQWRLWRMLARAASAIAAGRPLADAAADAGFSDQAHLTRTMTRFFGVTPMVAATSLRRRE
jgi:AraC-like DNA-binding protein